MGDFHNGELVYWNNSIGRYVGQDPYITTLSYVIDTHTGEVGTIQTASLSRKPSMTLRELNGKALFELLELTWSEVDSIRTHIDWFGDVTPDVKEMYMRLAEKLNYTAGE